MMAKKNRKKNNRQNNIQHARQRAAARARVPAGKARGTGGVEGVEFTQLPEDPVAGEAIRQIAETTDCQAAEAAVAAAEADAHTEEPVVESASDSVPEAGSTDEAVQADESAATNPSTAGEELAEPAADSPATRRGLPVWGRVLIGVGAVLAVILAVGIGFVSHFLSRIGRASDEEYTAEVSESVEDAVQDTDDEGDALDTMNPDEITWYGQTIEPIDDENIQNILLIGQDRREGDSKSELKRSDAMVIISLDQQTGKIKVCSLMRDMYVQIPGYGGNKLNYSYEKGGMELLDQTIEENLGVTIDNNVEVDFDGFVEAMSVVGNLDIYLSQAEIDFMEAHPTWADDSGADVTTWDLHEGLNSMTPSEYAVFCRLRMIGNNDFERTERQRRVLSAAFNKVAKGGVFNMLSVANAIIPYITTDMTNKEILSYVYTVVTKGMELSGQYRIPLDNTWTNQTINRAAVLVCDMETNTRALQEFLYGDEEGVAFTSEEQRAEEKESGTYTTDTYGTVNGGSSGYSSGSGSSRSYSNTSGTGAATGDASVDATEMEPITESQGIDGTTSVIDPAAADGTAAAVDPTGTGTDVGTDSVDPATIDAAAAEQAAAAAQAAAEQAAAAQALAEQAAAAQAAAEQAAAAQAAAEAATQ